MFASRMPHRVDHMIISQINLTNSAMEFLAISLTCCVCMNVNAIARPHTYKAMGPVRCNLRAAACAAAGAKVCREPLHANCSAQAA